MAYSIGELSKEQWSPLLQEISDPPKRLFYVGQMPDYNRKFLCIVGSRKYSHYGKEATEYLIQGLAGFPVTIVSGLALGIDAIAHRAAIKNNLPTIAIPGSGLNPHILHPQSHVQLAEEIVTRGGTLLSEFEPDFKATQWSFPQRNRVMAALSHAILVIEAETKSGTLITAKYASGYNKDLLALPGNIFSPNSDGPHMLLRIGATLIRSAEDILEVLGITSPHTFGAAPLLDAREGQNTKTRDYSDCSPDEIILIEILKQNSLPKDELLTASSLSAQQFNLALTLLELKGLIDEKLGEIHLRLR